MIFSKLQSELVVSNHIFQFLGWNDLLRLRRVCQDAKTLAEDYLRLHGTLKEFVYISDDRLSDFLSLAPDLPLSRFRLYNRDNSFFESEQMLTLVDLYGDRITHLSLNHLEIPMTHCPKAVQFFDALPNLCYLEADLELFQRGDTDQGSTSDDEENSPAAVPIRELTLPSVFKRLRHLKVPKYRCPPDLHSVQYLWSFLEECSTHLETILIPVPTWRGMNFAVNPGGQFDCVKRIVERRHEENPGNPNLKEIDLLEVEEDEGHESARSFYELVSTCSQHNVKLVNVDGNLIEGMMRLDTPDKDDHGRKISGVVTSVYDLHSSSFLLELPHLTKIFVNDGYTGTRVNRSMPLGREERQAWPNLKEVDILVESVEDRSGLQVDTFQGLDFFFKGIRRENVDTLKLSFDADEGEDDNLPIPKLRDVWSSCPNLKTLEICGWLGTNKAISKLWGHLPLLENLTFESCENLRNSAFIGKDKANPAMWKMKSLKSLSLNGLEKMPKIMDVLFTSVLRRMPLKELHLKSRTKNTTLTSITITGILSLLVGEFAKRIEKLELNISLQDVTDEELIDLGKLFRSSKMM